MKLGKSKFSSDKKEVFKIKDGDNIFRVLPPMGKLADAGVYNRFFRVVWGYKDSSGSLRPFISPRVQNFKTKMIDVDCAAYNRSMKLSADLEESKKQYKALSDKSKELAKLGKSVPAEIKNALTKVAEDIKKKKEISEKFNVDSKFHMNAMDQTGKIGLLKLGSRGMTALKAEFKKLEATGVDATAVENGRFMNITRSGEGSQTAYAAKEYKEKVQTAEYGEVEKAMPHTLDATIIKRLAAEAYELDEIYPAPSSEEVQMIVEAYERSEAEGQVMVDKVLGKRDDSAAKPTAKADAKADEAAAEEMPADADEYVAVSTEELAASEAAAEETPEDAGSVDMSTVPLNSAAETNEEFLARLGVKL